MFILTCILGRYNARTESDADMEGLNFSGFSPVSGAAMGQYGGGGVVQHMLPLELDLL
jgi:hypothetical protein